MNNNNYGFQGKENISGNMLFPREKLGQVPEHGAIGGKMDKKLADLELQMYLDEGEKRIAIIDHPLQPFNKSSLIAKKVFVSPMKLISGKKRSYTDSDPNLNRVKKTKPVQVRSNLNDALRLQVFTGKTSVTMSKVDREREFGVFIEAINRVQGVDESNVFDSCSEIVDKV